MLEGGVVLAYDDDVDGVAAATATSVHFMGNFQSFRLSKTD